jgi:hypothetical protein
MYLRRDVEQVCETIDRMIGCPYPNQWNELRDVNFMHSLKKVAARICIPGSDPVNYMLALHNLVNSERVSNFGLRPLRGVVTGA